MKAPRAKARPEEGFGIYCKDGALVWHHGQACVFPKVSGARDALWDEGEQIIPVRIVPVTRGKASKGKRRKA